MIGRLLSHTNVHMTARYAHLANNPLKSAANHIANRIADIAWESARSHGMLFDAQDCPYGHKNLMS